jgi:hypothetical protein
MPRCVKKEGKFSLVSFRALFKIGGKTEYCIWQSYNNNNNNNLFSIRYSNALSYTIHKVLLYNIGIKKIGNSRLLVFVYNKIL